jgi:hypothetical protein
VHEAAACVYTFEPYLRWCGSIFVRAGLATELQDQAAAGGIGRRTNLESDLQLTKEVPRPAEHS